MNRWIDSFYFFIIGAMLLLSMMGLWFTAILPGIDRWGKRFFHGFFLSLMLNGACGFADMVLYNSSAPTVALKFMLALESLLLSLPLPMQMVYLLHCCGKSKHWNSETSSRDRLYLAKPGL